jgi:hypothetical protein
MTSMADCIQRGVSFDRVDPARAADALANYNALLARYSIDMSPGQAAARAAKDIKEATKKGKTQRYHKVLNQLQAMRRIRNLIETSPNPAIALRNLLEFSDGSGFKGESVASLTAAYETSILAGLRDTLKAVGLNIIGSTRNPVLMDKLVRELHGEATGDAAAAAFAKAVRGQQQHLRRAFNAHGGDIGNLSDYGVPHAHDAILLRSKGFDAWAAHIETRLAWDRIPDFTTGQMFAAAPGQMPPRADIVRFLQDVYDGITTKGWDDRDPSMAMGGKALYNQRADHRVLHFKSGTSWLEYNAEFGTADPFTAMMNGLNGLARDVAMMRVLGPSPRAGLNFAAQVARKRAADLRDPKLQDKVRYWEIRTKTMLSHIDGTANRPESIAAARFFGGIRAVLVSNNLGSAVVSSVTDVATMSMAAHMMGMNPANLLGKSVKLMFSHATRETAARMGYVAETIADTGGGSARYFGQMFGSGIPDRLAGFTLRATGLTFVTDMRKIAFQMEFAGFMAENAARDFAAIDAPLRRMFESRGITAVDWDALRNPATRFVAPNGADFIAPMYWLEAQTAMPRAEAEGLAMRVQMLTHEQLEFAIPTANIEGREFMVRGNAPGSAAGEILRSSGSYKSFAMSLLLNQYRRLINLPTVMDKVNYAAMISGLLILTGAVALQLKSLTKGNDPLPMTTMKFWWAAAFQGGGLGIFGDFFASETNRMGGGIPATIAGPVAGFIGDVVGPVASNVNALVQGRDTAVGSDAVNFLRRNTPFLSSAWYARTAYSRVVIDYLSGFVDPKADVKRRRALQKQYRDFGTQPFIGQRGSGSPTRAPDFSNIFGGNQ